MSRSLSSTAIQAINGQETAEVFIILLTLDHPDLSQPIRVSSDSVATTSRSNTFVSFPFQLSLPDDKENSSPRARLSIDNVDRQIVTALRSINSAPTLLMEIILASDPDIVEASFPDFKLTNVSYNARIVEGDLTIEDFTSEPYPSAVFSPGFFPGIF